MTREPDRTIGYLNFRCDGCDARVAVHRNPARWASDDRAVEVVGWQTVRADGLVRHFCPACQEQMA
jgi:hypothetical protein